MNSGMTGHWLPFSVHQITAEVSPFGLSFLLVIDIFLEFDNYGACMRLEFTLSSYRFCTDRRISVSEDLLCAFELLKPLDGAALRKEMTKAKRKRSDYLT